MQDRIRKLVSDPSGNALFSAPRHDVGRVAGERRYWIVYTDGMHEAVTRTEAMVAVQRFRGVLTRRGKRYGAA